MNQVWAYSFVGDEDLSRVLTSIPIKEIDPEALKCLAPSKRGIGSRYSPRDYWALPDPWYSDRWTDLVIDLIDKENGDREDLGIPGIINENGMYKVFSFFNCERVHIGEYTTLSRAEAALIKYNNTVTQRGYGVDE